MFSTDILAPVAHKVRLAAIRKSFPAEMTYLNNQSRLHPCRSALLHHSSDQLLRPLLVLSQRISRGQKEDHLNQHKSRIDPTELAIGFRRHSEADPDDCGSDKHVGIPSSPSARPTMPLSCHAKSAIEPLSPVSSPSQLLTTIPSAHRCRVMKITKSISDSSNPACCSGSSSLIMSSSPITNTTHLARTASLKGRPFGAILPLGTAERSCSPTIPVVELRP